MWKIKLSNEISVLEKHLEIIPSLYKHLEIGSVTCSNWQDFGSGFELFLVGRRNGTISIYKIHRNADQLIDTFEHLLNVFENEDDLCVQSVEAAQVESSGKIMVIAGKRAVVATCLICFDDLLKKYHVLAEASAFISDTPVYSECSLISSTYNYE